MIRLRVSTLDAFRRIVSTSYGDEAELVERLRRGQWAEGPSNSRMDAGTAWHAILANAKAPAIRPAMCSQKTARGNVYPSAEVAEIAAYQMRSRIGAFIEAFLCQTCRKYHLGRPTDNDEELGNVRRGDYCFAAHTAAQARLMTGPGITELTGCRTWTVGGRLVQIEGTCDHIRGLVLTDHKTTFSPPDAKNYEHSLQWRAYLLIHEARCFRYLCWHFSDPTAGGYCDFKDVVAFRFWPYVGMESDLLEWLERFLDWADSRRLMSFIDTARVLAA